MRLLPKAFLCTLACIICIAILQIGAVFYLPSNQQDLTSADLVVVLPGSSERITAGCRAAAETKADNLMLINSSTKKLQNYAKKNNVPETVNLLAGGSSRSSFEDVYNTVQTIKNTSLHFNHRRNLGLPYTAHIISIVYSPGFYRRGCINPVQIDTETAKSQTKAPALLQRGGQIMGQQCRNGRLPC